MLMVQSTKEKWGSKSRESYLIFTLRTGKSGKTTSQRTITAMFAGSFWQGKSRGKKRKMNIKYQILLGLKVDGNKFSYRGILKCSILVIIRGLKGALFF